MHKLKTQILIISSIAIATIVAQAKEDKYKVMPNGAILQLDKNDPMNKLFGDDNKINTKLFNTPTKYPAEATQFDTAYKKWKKRIEKSNQLDQEKFKKDTIDLEKNEFDLDNIKQISPYAGRTLIRYNQKFTGIPSGAIIFVPEKYKHLINFDKKEINQLIELDTNDFIHKHKNLFFKQAVNIQKIEDSSNKGKIIKAFVMPKTAIDYAKTHKKILIATYQNGICGHPITIK